MCKEKANYELIHRVHPKNKTFIKEIQISIPIPSTQIVVCMANSVILHLNYQFLIRWVKIYFVSSFCYPIYVLHQ